MRRASPGYPFTQTSLGRTACEEGINPGLGRPLCAPCGGLGPSFAAAPSHRDAPRRDRSRRDPARRRHWRPGGARRACQDSAGLRRARQHRHTRARSARRARARHRVRRSVANPADAYRGLRPEDARAGRRRLFNGSGGAGPFAGSVKNSETWTASVLARRSSTSTVVFAEREITPVIPPKSNRKTKRDYDFALYRERNLIERFFNKIKQFRANCLIPFLFTKELRRHRAMQFVRDEHGKCPFLLFQTIPDLGLLPHFPRPEHYDRNYQYIEGEPVHPDNIHIFTNPWQRVGHLCWRPRRLGECPRSVLHVLVACSLAQDSDREHRHDVALVHYLLNDFRARLRSTKQRRYCSLPPGHPGGVRRYTQRTTPTRGAQQRREAQERSRLDAKLDDARKRLAALRTDAPAPADARSQFLSALSRGYIQPRDVRVTLVALFAVMVEVCATLGLFAALSHSSEKPNAPINPSTPVSVPTLTAPQNFPLPSTLPRPTPNKNW